MTAGTFRGAAEFGILPRARLTEFFRGTHCHIEADVRHEGDLQ